MAETSRRTDPRQTALAVLRNSFAAGIHVANPTGQAPILRKQEPARYRTANWKSYNDALKRGGALLDWPDRDMARAERRQARASAGVP